MRRESTIKVWSGAMPIGKPGTPVSSAPSTIFLAIGAGMRSPKQNSTHSLPIGRGMEPLEDRRLLCAGANYDAAGTYLGHDASFVGPLDASEFRTADDGQGDIPSCDRNGQGSGQLRRVPRAALPTLSPVPIPPLSHDDQLRAEEVATLLQRAAAASVTDDAIIAVVDRGGRILGVRVEAGVDPNLTANPENMVFAIDGAVAKARTAAFFANNTAPLSSRLIRFISQSTITEREVDSNPSSLDPTVRGPGFVAPIGLGGHFPPEIDFTPLVDLFAIEHTNRDSSVHPGPDHIKGTPDDIPLPGRFNEAELTGILEPPDSYGFISGIDEVQNAQARGIATLPGGLPLFKDANPNDQHPPQLVGGIGVFFPGPNGFATFEQQFRSNRNPVTGEPLPKRLQQTEKDRTNSPLTLESELIAIAAAGGIDGKLEVGAIPTNDQAPVPPLPGFELPFGRLTLVGIELEVYGPHPFGFRTLKNIDLTAERNQRHRCQNVCIGGGDPDSVGFSAMLDDPGAVQIGVDFVRDGMAVREGWLVGPTASATDNITKEDVEQIIDNALAQADKTRAAIRLPFGSRTKMVFAVADSEGTILGLFRMPDATVFSIDVAVAKARNTAYYADATAIQDIDRVDTSIPGNPPVLLDPGVAFTNRTFRFVADPRFPDGVDGTPPAPFSVLNDPGTDPLTAENIGPPVSFELHTSVLGFDAFNPGTNFRDPDDIANQNGIVFFPGSTPIYKGGTLLGGFGVSGDGVDQDDVVTFFGSMDFLPPDEIVKADEVFVRGVRLPYIKWLRNPEG